MLGIKPRTLLAYESGEYEPPSEMIEAIAKALGFPIDFFSGPTIYLPNGEGVSFRSMSGMTAGQRDSALGAAAIGVALCEWITTRFELPEPNIPTLRGQDAQTAAETLRTEWNLGERPIKNIVHLLEAHGVRVLSLAEHSREVDAFSFWRGSEPYVFLNLHKSAEHGRFDAAHELGHLVLHRHGGPRGKGFEHEADTFASAFLMPRGSVVATAPQNADVELLIKLKAVWNVSVAALNYRLHEVGRTSEWKYRHACIDISKRGFRTSEPEPAPRETSQVLHKVFQELRAEGLGRADVARTLCIDVAELDSLVFGLVFTRLEGSALPPTPRSTKANLRRV